MEQAGVSYRRGAGFFAADIAFASYELRNDIPLIREALGKHEVYRKNVSLLAELLVWPRRTSLNKGVIFRLISLGGYVSLIKGVLFR